MSWVRTGGPRGFGRRSRRQDNSDVRVDSAIAAVVLIMFVLAGAQCGHALYEAGLLPDVGFGWRMHAERARTEKRASVPSAEAVEPRAAAPMSATPWTLYLLAGLVSVGILGVALNDRELRAHSSRAEKRKELDEHKREL